MILSAALDNGYIFMSLIAIITSVIGAGYYLNLVKQVFFYQSSYKENNSANNITLIGYILPNNYYMDNVVSYRDTTIFTWKNITINSALSNSISIISLLLLLFIFIPEEWFNIISILTIIQFKV